MTKKKRFLQFFALLAALAIWPSTFIFLRSLWVTEVTASEEKHENALIFLAEETFFSRSQARNRKYLSGYFDHAEVNGTVYSMKLHLPASSEYVPIIHFASCFEPKLMDDPKKLKAVRIIGWPYSQRVEKITRANNLLLAQKLGTVRLAAINACLAATPFTDTCSEWLDDAVVDDAAVISVLVKSRDIYQKSKIMCWTDNDYEAAQLAND